MLNRRAFTSTLTLGGMSTILPKSSDVNLQYQTKPIDKDIILSTGFALLPDLYTIVKNCGHDNEDGYYWGQVLASIVLPNILRYIDESTHIDMDLSMESEPLKTDDGEIYFIDRDTSMIRIIEHHDLSAFKNIELYKIDNLFQIIVDKFCIEIKQNNITAISKPYIFLDITQETRNKLGFGLRGDYYL